MDFPPLNDHLWGYGQKNGPNTWQDKYVNAASGLLQAPIDIRLEEGRFIHYMNEPYFRWEWPSKKNNEMRFVKTDHGFKIRFVNRKECWITGGILRNMIYEIEEMHMKFGLENDKGSEHKINGQRFAAELQFVCWAPLMSTSFEMAHKIYNSLVIVCFLIKEGTLRNEKFRELEHFVRKRGKDFAIEEEYDMDVNFDVYKITRELEIKNEFFTYKGSMTVPPCYESAYFVVYNQPIELRADQLAAFRSIHDETTLCCGQPIAPQYRPTQDDNLRKIQTGYLRKKDDQWFRDHKDPFDLIHETETYKKTIYPWARDIATETGTR